MPAIPREQWLLPTLEACIPRRVYKIRCRNLRVGVFDRHGFIGIRTKFGERRLDHESHYDTGAPFGTVTEAIDTWIDLPSDVAGTIDLGTIDEVSGRRLVRDPIVENPNQVNYAHKLPPGWWRFEDTGELAPAIKGGSLRPMGLPNPALFAFLDTFAERRWYRVIQPVVLGFETSQDQLDTILEGPTVIERDGGTLYALTARGRFESITVAHAVDAWLASGHLKEI